MQEGFLKPRPATERVVKANGSLQPPAIQPTDNPSKIRLGPGGFAQVDTTPTPHPSKENSCRSAVYVLYQRAPTLQACLLLRRLLLVCPGQQHAPASEQSGSQAHFVSAVPGSCSDFHSSPRSQEGRSVMENG